MTSSDDSSAMAASATCIGRGSQIAAVSTSAPAPTPVDTPGDSQPSQAAGFSSSVAAMPFTTSAAPMRTNTAPPT